MNAPIRISISNQSTLFADADLPALANALQIQVTRDFLPAWGVDAKIFYTPSGKNPSPDHWVIGLFDDSDQAGALGYHDITPAGLPLGKAFVRTTLAAGDLVSVTVSHELLEILGDPDVNLSAQSDSLFYAYEVADMVEADADGYDITIPSGWPGAGTVVRVSNFALPSWWEGFRTSGPFDFLGLLTQPFELRPDGYISYLDLANPNQGWQQLTPRAASTAARIKARPHVGSRRLRRALPRSEWIQSTYQPGSPVDAVQASVGGAMPPHVPQPGAQEKRMQKISLLKVTIPISPPLSSDDVENIITSSQNLSMNLGQIPAEEVELVIQPVVSTGASPAQLGELGKRISEETATIEKADEILTNPNAPPI